MERLGARLPQPYGYCGASSPREIAKNETKKHTHHSKGMERFSALCYDLCFSSLSPSSFCFEYPVTLTQIHQSSRPKYAWERYGAEEQCTGESDISARRAFFSKQSKQALTNRFRKRVSTSRTKSYTFYLLTVLLSSNPVCIHSTIETIVRLTPPDFEFQDRLIECYVSRDLVLLRTIGS